MLFTSFIWFLVHSYCWFSHHCIYCRFYITCTVLWSAGVVKMCKQISILTWLKQQQQYCRHVLITASSPCMNKYPLIYSSHHVSQSFPGRPSLQHVGLCLLLLISLYCQMFTYALTYAWGQLRHTSTDTPPHSGVWLHAKFEVCCLIFFHVEL